MRAYIMKQWARILKHIPGKGMLFMLLLFTVASLLSCGNTAEREMLDAMPVITESAEDQSNAVERGFLKNNSTAKKVVSEDLIHFEAECRFYEPASDKKYTYVYGYATRVEHGALIGLAYKIDGEEEIDRITFSKMDLVSETVFEDLKSLAQRNDFASKNGISNNVSGLPKDFGGKVKLRYASGEKIEFSDNQSSVISIEAGGEIVDILEKYMQTRSIAWTHPGEIIALTYRDEMNKDNYTQYHLDANHLVSESKYGRFKETYKKEYKLDEDMLYLFRNIVKEYSLLNWSGMLQSSGRSDSNKQLIFTMKDGSEIMIVDSFWAPDIEIHAFKDRDAVPEMNRIREKKADRESEEAQGSEVFDIIAFHLNEMEKDANAGFLDKTKYRAPSGRDIGDCEAYAKILDMVYDLARNSHKNLEENILNSEVPDHFAGIMECSAVADMQDEIGYIFFDMDQDGVNELLIGVDDDNEYFPGTRILAAFRYDGLEGIPLVYSVYRNAWYMLESGELYNHGSSGSAHTVEALYQLSGKGGGLECKDMYFTAPSGSGADLQWHRSPNGIESLEAEGVTQVKEAEYYYFSELCRSNLAYLELTPISHWGIAGIQIEEYGKMSNPPKDYLFCVDHESEYTVEAILHSKEVCRDFSWLKVHLNKIGDDGRPHYVYEEIMHIKSLEKPLLVNLKFLEYSSNRGFSCLDRFGNRVYYHIYMSGKDGSIQVERFEP